MLGEVRPGGGPMLGAMAGRGGRATADMCAV